MLCTERRRFLRMEENVEGAVVAKLRYVILFLLLFRYIIFYEN